MTPRAVSLRHPTNAELRLAIVSLQPGDAAGAFVVSVARGAKRTKLTDARLYGPFSADEGQEAFASVLAGLRQDGYLPSGAGELIETVSTSKSPRQRARAEERLGWRKEGAAVDALLARAEKPKDDISTLVLALGRIGDLRGLPIVRAEAERKLLSRRRAGAEAARLLNDNETIAGVVARALERLPDGVRAALNAADANAVEAAANVADAVVALAGDDADKRGAACDALYDVGSAVAVAAARGAILRLDIAKPHVWRYCKSMIKRAQMRNDFETLGALVHAVEVKGRTTKGTTAKLKSGLDGETRSTRVFSRKTVDWVRRSTWRFLRRLATHRPELYARAAAWCIAPYVNEDEVVPVKRLPGMGKSYLLCRVLFGASPRFVVDGRTLRTLWKGPKAVAPVPGQREEAFSSLWDRDDSAAAYVIVLARAHHRLAVRFAVDAITRRPAILEQASTPDLARMLASPNEQIADLAFTALRGRFDDGAPDVDAIVGVGAVDNDRARTLAGLWLTSSAHVWTRDPAASARLLSGPPAVRAAASRLLLLALPAASTSTKAALCDALLSAIDRAEPSEGAFSGWAEVATALGPELVARCSLPQALALLERHDAGAAVAVLVVGGLDAPLAALGAPRLLRLATAEAASKRGVVIAALQKTPAVFRAELALTLTLAEGDFDDVRAACVAVLDGFAADPAGADIAADVGRVIAIFDSTWPAVQNVARRLVEARFKASEGGDVDVHELLARLAQHPHKNLRAFVVDLAVAHLKPGYVRLAKLEGLARRVLFDTRPDVALRKQLIAFLRARGEKDEAQAELVAQLLGEIVRTRTHDAKDDALAALVALRLAWPSAVLPDHIVVDVVDVGSGAASGGAP
jgi:hypothetical protein